MQSGSPKLRTDFLAEVLAYIEAHPFEPMSVLELASIVGLSPYHFSRRFSARVGESVMGYVRTCRLQAAALRLAGDSPPSLAELALDAGFGSQEAFTRAFRRRYGCPPGQYRRRRGAQPREGRASRKALDPTCVVALGLERRGPFSIAGLRAEFDDRNRRGIPALWPSVMRSAPLEGQIGGTGYGATWLGRDGGHFNYLAGFEVDRDARLPDNFIRLDLAAQTYAVFRLTLDGTPFYGQLQAALPKITSHYLPGTGLDVVEAPFLEVYPEDFRQTRQGAFLDLYAPVEAGPEECEAP